MEIFGLLAALVCIAVAAYAQLKIPAFTDSVGKTVFIRLLLIIVGAAFGIVSSLYVTGTPQKLFSFFTSFGMVHMPAAVILFVKERRGETRS